MPMVNVEDSRAEVVIMTGPNVRKMVEAPAVAR
jgi:hypothetical protein